MDFNFFTPQPTPNIPVNLYADAATAGIKAGKELPTTTTAIIEGAQKGIETGLDLTAKYQQNQIRQNEIDQQPVQNQIQQEKLIQMQLKNEVDSLDADVRRDTQDLELYHQREKLMAESSELRSKRELIEQKDSFFEQFSNADPQTRKEMVTSGQYAQVFASDPKVYKQALTNVWGTLSEQERQSADRTYKRVSVMDKFDKEALKRAPKFNAAESELNMDGAVQEASAKTKIPIEEIPYKIQEVPTGKYLTNDNGEIELENGKLKVNPEYSVATAAKGVDWRIGNKIVAVGVSSESKKRVHNYIVEDSYRNNTFKNEALKKIDDDEQAQLKKQSQQTNPISTIDSFSASAPPVSSNVTNLNNTPNQSIEEQLTPKAPSSNISKIQDIRNIKVQGPKGDITLSKNPQAYSTARNILGVSVPQFDRIKQPVKNLFTYTESKTADSSLVKDIAEEELEDVAAESKREISNYLSAEEFKYLPESVKSREYGEGAVQQHNAQVASTRRFINENRPLSIPSKTSLSNLTEVNTPEELYTLKRRSYYDNLLNRMVSEYSARLTEAKKAKAKRDMLSSSITKVLKNG